MSQKNKIISILAGCLLLAGALAAGFYGWKRPFKPAPQGVKVQNSSQDFLADQGKALYKKQSYAPLIAVYEKMLAQTPQSNDLKIKLGLAYFSAGEEDKATRLLNETTASNPQNGDLWFALGSIAYHQGDLKKAKESLNRSLTIDPTHEQAKRLLSRIP